MASAEFQMLLDGDVAGWNHWREENSESHPDLSNLSLSRQRLSGVNLRRCNLSGAHFNHTDLTDCDLFRANLSNVSFVGANLARANCLEMHAAGGNFSAARFERAQIRDANLTDICLTDAKLESADLSGSDLSRANCFQADMRFSCLKNSKLNWGNLTRVNLLGANLQMSNLTGSSFIEADLSRADFRSADLRFARFIDSNLDEANISGCRVYGVSVWNVTSESAIQSDLMITPPGEATISVDNFEVAQFVYLLLNNSRVRGAIDTITSKVVLILGRFTPERMHILAAIRDVLRDEDYLPLLFDFAGPTARDLTETISTLAHLARFVVADLTDARSLPQELLAIVPNLPSVPLLPVLQESQQEYGLFEHFKRYPWVMKTALYRDVDDLLNTLRQSLLEQAESAVQTQRPVQ